MPDRPGAKASRSAVIAGGGIGGMAAALALALRGWEVTVCERSRAFGEVGAGLQMSPNASRCLDALGVLGAVRAAGFAPRAGVIRDGRSGRATLELALRDAAVKRWGAPYLNIHRADLLTALLSGAQSAGVTLRVATEVTGWSGGNGAVTARLDDGHELSGDLLVIADGVRSRLREQMHGPVETRFTGQVAWRATVPARLVAEGTIPPDSTVWSGPGRHLVTYFLRGGTLINLVGVEETPDWVEEGWSVAGEASRMRALFAGWDQRLTSVLEQVEAPMRWGLFTRDNPPGWVEGRAVLLGDACHPMLPFMAQGAAMAIEDAVCLAAALDAHPVDEALSRYDALRRPRTRKVQEVSRENAGLFHREDGARRSAEAAGMTLGSRMAQGLLASRLDWLYGHDAREIG